jgi:hypothetical protein
MPLANVYSCRYPWVLYFHYAVPSLLLCCYWGPPVIGFSTEYLNFVCQLWTDAVFYSFLILMPVVCLARGFARK